MSRSSRRLLSKDEALGALHAVARKLRRAPTRMEFMRLSGIHYCKLTRHFRGYRAALRAAGLEPHPGGLRVATAALMEDWGRVARKMGRIPTRAEYERHGRYATASLETRFQRWSRVHTCFLNFAEAVGLAAKWADVLERIRYGPAPQRGGGKSWLRQPPAGSHTNSPGTRPDSADGQANVIMPAAASAALPPQLAGMKRVTLAMLAVLVRASPVALSRRVFPDRPVMGPPLALPGLAHEPVNEMGVVFLFGMIAHRLGFLVECLQAGFPDCEAKREVEPGRWQRVRIEFEYESRKFRDHRHDPGQCDLIVCWRHNWAGCPRELEVLELSAILRRPHAPASASFVTGVDYGITP
jgi:Homing endonuclease associated repeat